MRAIRVQEVGDPGVLACLDAPTPEPGAGEARVKIEVAGVNFIDTYHRRGWYPMPLPFTPGVEGAGVVDAVGEGVTEVEVGDDVSYGMTAGSYAEYAVVPSKALVKRGPGVDARHGAAAMIQGLTAHYLACTTYPLKPGDTCLVHAAAGGTGALLVQIAKLRGARVIGTVSTAEKERIALAAGADEAVRYTEVDFAEAVRDLTGGDGVEVVYDSVGVATFDKSLDCLKPRGYMVLFGNASGVVRSIDPQVLNTKGSLFLTRPTLASHMRTRQELEGRANDIFGWIADGKLTIRIDRTFPLEDARDAHTYLEARQTKGKVLLTT